MNMSEQHHVIMMKLGRLIICQHIGVKNVGIQKSQITSIGQIVQL